MRNCNKFSLWPTGKDLVSEAFVLKVASARKARTAAFPLPPGTPPGWSGGHGVKRETPQADHYRLSPAHRDEQ